MLEYLANYITDHLLELMVVCTTFLTYNAVKAKPLVACKLQNPMDGEPYLTLTVYNVGKANAFDIAIDIDPPINTAKDIQGNNQVISKLNIPFLLPDEREIQRLINPKELEHKLYIVKATYYSKSKGLFTKIGLFKKVTKSTIDITDGHRILDKHATLYSVVEQLKLIAKNIGENKKT